MARARVVLQFVHCDKTTELAHDELYVMVGSKHGDDKISSHVVPGANNGDAGDEHSCWDINDSGSLQNRWLRAIIYDADLPPEAKAEIKIVFAEQDGGGVKQAVAAAATLANAVGTAVAPAKIVGIALEALSKLIPKNADDVLGGVFLTMQNSGGSLKWTVQSDEQERAKRDDATWLKDKNITAGLGEGFCLQLNGDGARYQAYLNLYLT